MRMSSSFTCHILFLPSLPHLRNHRNRAPESRQAHLRDVHAVYLNVALLHLDQSQKTHKEGRFPRARPANDPHFFLGGRRERGREGGREGG